MHPSPSGNRRTHAGMNESSAPTSPPVQSRPRPIFYAAAAIGLTGLSMYYTVLPILGTPLREHYQVNVAQLGLLLSISAIPVAVSTLLAGLLLERFNTRKVFFMGLILALIGSLLAGLSWTWTLLLLAAVLLSGAAQWMWLTCQAYTTELYPDQRRRALTWLMAILSMFSLMFPLLIEGLLWGQRHFATLTFSYVLYAPFLLMLPVFLLGLLHFRRPHPFPRVEAPAQHKETAVPAASPHVTPAYTSVRWPLAMLITHSIADGAAAAWLATVMTSKSFPEYPFRPGVAFSLAAVGYVVTRVTLGFLPEHFCRRSFLIFPGLLGGSSFLLGVLSRSQILLGLGYVIGCWCWSIEYPSAVAAMADRQPAKLARNLAIVGISSGLLLFMVIYGLGWAGQALGETRLWWLLVLPAVGFIGVGLCGLGDLKAQHRANVPTTPAPVA